MASESFGSAKGGLHFLNPLPPFGQFCIHYAIPVSISPDCIAAFNSQTLAAGGRPQQSGIALPIGDITKVSVRDMELWLNGCLFCKCKTAVAVSTLAELIDAMRQRSPDERGPLIEAFWSRQCDLASAKEEQATVRANTRMLRALCIAQFVYLYLLLPCIMTLYGLTRLLIPAAIFMLVLAIQVAIEYFLVHKHLFPAAKGDRISHVIKMIMCPPVCIRAVDLLMSHAGSRHNSLTMATLLLADAEREAFIGATVRDLRFPLAIDGLSEPAAATCKWQNATIERIASQQLPPVEECVRSFDNEPVREGAEARSFCPRCRVQLSIENSECPDCPGIPLKSFTSINVVQTVQPS
jgi:hypothetical protein